MRSAIIAAVIAVLGASNSAGAQVDGKTKLGLVANGLSYASYDSGGPEASSEISIGPLSPNGGLVASLVGLPPVGLDIGYGASEEVLVGAILRMGVTIVDPAAGDSENVYGLGLLPHVDYVASAGSTFRPYVGGLVGITVLDGSGGGDAVSYVTVGAHVGGFGFVGESFSVGPRLALTYSPGISDAVSDNSVFAVQAQLELAGWL